MTSYVEKVPAHGTGAGDWPRLPGNLSLKYETGYPESTWFTPGEQRPLTGSGDPQRVPSPCSLQLKTVLHESQ